MTEPAEGVLKKTILFDLEKELGARFNSFHSWVMAESYGDPLREQKLVRSHAGLIDLSYCGAIKVGGNEGAQFLHGLVTNDVKGLGKQKGMHAGFLTGHGKVKALCRIYGFGDEYLVITDPQTHEKIYNYVFPFSYAGDFKAEDVSDDYRLISVQGPNSLLVMKEVCFEPVPSLDENEWIDTTTAGHQVMVARASHTGEQGFDIFVPAAGLKDVWDFILLKGQFHSIVPFGLRALEALRVEAGIPVYGVDVDETNMMLETGLSDAVSYSKGCYTGQEAVAMATYRGHVSKKLSGLIIPGDRIPSQGDKVSRDGKEIGFITSAIKSETLQSVIAMAYIKYGHFDPSTAVEINVENETIAASVVELPFYKTASGN